MSIGMVSYKIALISYFLNEQCRKEVKFIPVECIFINGFSLMHEQSDFFKEVIIARNNTSHEVLEMEFH